jgi:broad specificity phosphatase PhoE
MEDGWYHLGTIESHSEYLIRAAMVVEWLWTLQATRSDDEGGIILVLHGNLMNAIIGSLISGHPPVQCRSGLVTHNNTGITHLKLYSLRNSSATSPVSSERRFVSVQYINRVDHLRSLSGSPSMLSGNEPFKDHWVQEFLV